MTAIRIPFAVQNELYATSLMQQRNEPWSLDATYATAARTLADKLDARSTRKDRSISVDLDRIEARIIYSYMQTWEIGAADNVRDDPAYLSQIRSARAMMRGLTETFGDLSS